MKKLNILKNWRLEIGSNRIVLVFTNIVIKIPKHIRGLKANYEEYINYHRAPKNMVAKVIFISGIVIQERLFDIRIYALKETPDTIPKFIQHLYEIKLHNRLQVGRNKIGVWKIFDYEDVKFKNKKEV